MKLVCIKNGYGFTINEIYEGRKITHSIGWFIKNNDSKILFASVESTWEGPLLSDYFITIGERRNNQIDDILN